MSSPRHDGESTKWVCSPSSTCGTHVTTRPVDGGSPAMTLGGHWQGCLGATHAVSRCYCHSRHRPTPTRTPPWSDATSSPSTASVAGQLNFARPRAAAGECYPASPLRMPRRAARRDASNTSKRPRPMTMGPTSSKLQRS
jgi:hypothetical protein